MEYQNPQQAIYELEIALTKIQREKDNINLMRYNARWLKEKTPQLIAANLRRKELILLEKETKLLLKLAKPPKVVLQKNTQNFKTRAFGAAKLDALNDDACGICMEVHALRDSVHTSCGHCFGSVCYRIYLQHTHAHEQHLHRVVQQLQLQPNAPHQDVFAYMLQQTRNYACPMCRTKNPVLTSYKERAKPKSKPVRKTPVNTNTNTNTN